jgi:Asp/Glu/hydantoin racemase
MARVLVLNTNTSAAITSLVARELAARAPGIEWRPGTAAFGGAYIATEASYAIATHAALDVYARDGAGCDAVLLACFGDPGLFALREVACVPVVGLAEASMTEAAARGRYAIVTGGAAWRPMLERLALARGRGASLPAIRTVAPSGADIAADPARALAMLADACNACAREDGAQAVILGGAGLAGLAARVQPDVAVPVIDSVHAGARAIARALAGPKADRGRVAEAPMTGLSAPLTDLLARG